MSASDPSGAEMRSPNALCGRAFSNMGEYDPPMRCELAHGHDGKHVMTKDDMRYRWAENRSDAEVSPRSSGGAPTDTAPNAVRLEQLARRIERYCDNGRPNDPDALRREAAYLRTVAAQVSALRQEAAALTEERDGMRARYVIDTASLRAVAEHEMADASTARQEAETLRGQLDAAQKALGTEQTMHRAWRKRAEEAEAERTPTGLSAELTPLTDEQRDAFDDFVRASLETDKEVIAKLRRELLERNFPRAARVAAPREPT